MPLAKLSLLVVVGTSIAGAAFATPMLENDQHITETLTAAAVAKKITDECPSAEPKLLVALQMALALESYAKSEGASDDEIDAFINSKEQKNRIIGEATAYFAGYGVSADSPSAAFCALAKDEVENDRLAGRIIRIK